MQTRGNGMGSQREKKKRKIRESANDVHEAQNQTVSFKQLETIRNQYLNKRYEIGKISKQNAPFFI